MEDIKRNIIWRFKEKDYNIFFPKVGQYMEIESQKIALSLGQYGGMARSSTLGSFNALNMIDMAATIPVICPEIIVDMKVDNIKDLDLSDAIDLHKSYVDNIVDWMNSWTKLFQNAFKVNEDDKEDKKEE